MADKSCSEQDKENLNNNQATVGQIIISEQDKTFIKTNIFEALHIALYQLNDKRISSELENIFYNIVQTDFAAGQWNDCLP